MMKLGAHYSSIGSAPRKYNSGIHIRVPICFESGNWIDILNSRFQPQILHWPVHSHGLGCRSIEIGFILCGLNHPLNNNNKKWEKERERMRYVKIIKTHMLNFYFVRRSKHSECPYCIFILLFVIKNVWYFKHALHTSIINIMYCVCLCVSFSLFIYSFFCFVIFWGQCYNCLFSMDL